MSDAHLVVRFLMVRFPRVRFLAAALVIVAPSLSVAAGDAAYAAVEIVKITWSANGEPEFAEYDFPY